MADQGNTPSGSSKDEMAPHVLAAADRAGRPQHHHRLLGLVSGAASFGILMLIGAPAGMPDAAWATLAVASLMAIWWATEALPLSSLSVSTSPFPSS